MTKDEALKMAIEALNDSLTRFSTFNEMQLDAIQACKEALDTKRVCENEAQPAQDYGDWFPIGLDAETGNRNHDRYAEGWNDCLNECWEAYDRYKNCPIEQPTMTYEQGFAHGYEAHRVEQELEQPAQDFFERGKEIAKWADKQNEQKAQEPVGYYYPDERSAYLLFQKGLEIPKDALPLYESFAPSWQGLSDDELDEIVDSLNVSLILDCSIADFVNAIEARLKEKNN